MDAYSTSAPSRTLQALCTALLLVTSTPPSTEYAVLEASGWSGVSGTPSSCSGGEGGGGEGGGDGGGEGGGDGGGGEGGGEGGGDGGGGEGGGDGGGDSVSQTTQS